MNEIHVVANTEVLHRTSGKETRSTDTQIQI